MPYHVIDPSIDRPARRLLAVALTGILGVSSSRRESIRRSLPIVAPAVSRSASARSAWPAQVPSASASSMPAAAPMPA